MEYRVYVVSYQAALDGDVRVQHTLMYRGLDESMARMAAAHYERPNDGIAAELVQVATEADGVGWVGERMVR
jgi:hypothetical protein